MGFYKVFDDLTCFYLEEIVMLKNYQWKGLGTLLINEVEEIVKENHVDLYVNTFHDLPLIIKMKNKEIKICVLILSI